MLKIALKVDEEPKAFSIEEFEQIFGITYMKGLSFSDWATERWVRKKCARAAKRGKIKQLARWLGSYHSKEIKEAKVPEVAIRWMHEKIGYGLFTTKQFKKWQFIGEYTGILRRRNFIFRNINDYCFMYPRQWLAPRSYTIDSQEHGNYTRFINHTDYPNCESVSIYHDGVFHIMFRAIREIEKGEELTYDYGGIYWLRRKKIPAEKIEDLLPPGALATPLIHTAP